MDNAIGTGEWLRMMGSLVLVLLMLLATLWFWRWLQRRSMKTGGRHAQLQVQESLMLGARQKVALLRAGPLHVLVGVSPTGITTLAQWPATHAQPLDTTEGEP